MQKYRIFYIIIASAIFIFGLVNFIRVMIPPVDPKVEMPLGYVNGIAIDNTGNIYIALAFYGRVQVYDKTGHYLAGWNIDAAGGSFRIKIKKDDELNVATVRNGLLLTYSLAKGLIDKQHDERAFNDIGAESDNYVQCDDGTIYRVRGSIFYPHIVKRETSGKIETIIHLPFRKWLFMGPFPAFLFGFIGVIITVINIFKMVNSNFKCTT